MSRNHDVNPETKESKAAVARGGQLEPLQQALHDLRSPIAALEAAAYGGAAQLPVETRDLIRVATRRIRSITETLKSYASGGISSEVRPMLVHPIFLQTIDEMKSIAAHRRLPVRISALTAFGTRDLTAVAEPGQLARVIANLIQNGIEAIEGSGEIRVSLSRSSEWLVITVRDSGSGIAPEHLDQVTQRGFTHGKPEGTGLGLSHADEQVRVWGGRLRIRSEQGRGTSVEVWLRAQG